MTDGKPRTRRSLAGFYVGTGVVVLLLVGLWMSWPRVRAWHRERQVTKAFIRALDKHLNVDMEDWPAEEALLYFRGLLDVGFIVEGPKGADWNSKVTLQMEKVPIAAALDSWCAQVGADWTVADSGLGMDGEPAFKLIIADPERIKELEKASPTAARMIRHYRERIAWYGSKAKREKPGE